MPSYPLSGQGLAPGKAIGPVFIPSRRSWSRDVSSEPRVASAEMRRFKVATTALVGALGARVAALDGQGLADEAEILRAQTALLEDWGLQTEVVRSIGERELTAEEAVEGVLGTLSQTFEASGDALFRERAADSRDLAEQLLHLLASDAGVAAEPDPMLSAGGAVVVVDVLLPSLVLRGREHGAHGFVVAAGTPLAHAVIIARSLGIPVVRLASLDELRSMPGARVLVDGDLGTVGLASAADDVVALGPADRPDTRWREATLPVRLSVSVMAPEQLSTLDWRGVAGVGLYRTEMLFLQWADRFPTEQEQLVTYRRLFALCPERPIVIRTADLGADKPVEHLRLGPEVNPYLGLRAHRLFYYHPDILITQLRAILRAAAGTRQLRLLYPMLETVDQWDFVQSLLYEAIASLDAEGASIPANIQTGVLVETPAAVWSFPELIARADFASVGTNDLVQYMFAAERDAPNVAPFYVPEHPVILRVLRDLVSAARDAGKDLAICGEIASDPRYLPLLVGLGFSELTVAAGRIDAVGATIGRLDPRECERLVEECAAMHTAAAVRRRLGRGWFEDGARRADGGHAIDPVCGMRVTPGDGGFTIHRNGKLHHFCSVRCRDLFAGNTQ